MLQIPSHGVLPNLPPSMLIARGNRNRGMSTTIYENFDESKRLLTSHPQGSATLEHHWHHSVPSLLDPWPRDVRQFKEYVLKIMPVGMISIRVFRDESLNTAVQCGGTSVAAISFET